MTATMRPIFCDFGPISRADGSSMLSLGTTCVMACVYGPAEVRPQKELVDEAAVEVIFKPKMGMPSVPDKAKEYVVRNTCREAILTTLHPRTSVTVVLQELEDFGGQMACSVNAACLALMDASVSMKHLFAAVSCCVDEAGLVTLDPTKKQSRQSVAQVTFVFESRNKDLLSTHMEGRCSEENYKKCLLACREATDSIFQFYRESIKKKFSKEFA